MEISSRGQPTRGGPPACGLGVELTIPHHKKISLLQNVTKGLGLGPMEGSCEHGNEPSGCIKCWNILE
jgi:hypothetical protein